jgi:hypothetical protein
MTDTYHPLKSSKSNLDPCDQEILTFARQVGISGAFLSFGGVSALIATSGQTTWDILSAIPRAFLPWHLHKSRRLDRTMSSPFCNS